MVGVAVVPCLTCQGVVEAYTYLWSYASLLFQQLDRILASAESLKMDAQVRLV